MLPLAIAASLFLSAAQAAAPETAPPAEAASAAEPAPAADAAPIPPGAPSDDYRFVAWCYGALAGYLELHDEVMPEVTRIESTWRRPGSKLADDLKVYADQQRQGRIDMKRFRSAMTAAEKASVQPINTEGAAAIARGHAVWNAGPEVTTARKAQEWMSWSLPARCTATADTLEKRANLMAVSLQANAPEPAPEAQPPATGPAAPEPAQP